MKQSRRKYKSKKNIGIFSVHLFRLITLVFFVSLYSCSSVKESIIYYEFAPIQQPDSLYVKTTAEKTNFADKENQVTDTSRQENLSLITNKSEAIEPSEYLSENPVNDSEETLSKNASENSINESKENLSEDDIIDWQFYKKYSKKFGIDFDGTENPELIMAVDEWLDTRFQWGGCSKEGIDCSCLVKSIYKDVYDIKLNRTSISMFNDNDLISVKRKDLHEGDLLFFKTKGDTVSHVGIYMKDNLFLHASRTHGVIISNLNGKYYKERFVSGKRIPENGMRFAKFLNR